MPNCYCNAFMLKLGERTFMNNSKKINKTISGLLVICLVSLLMILSKDSLIFLLSIPIILSAGTINYNKSGYTAILALSILAGYLFLDLKDLGLILVPSLLLTIILTLLTRSKISDKSQILINFILASIIMTLIYKYEMISKGLDTGTLAIKLKEAFSQSELDNDIPDKVYELSASLYPAILSTVGFIYSVVSLKLMRNYMHYKDKGSDMVSLNTIRMTRNNFFILIGISLVVFLFVPQALAMDKSIILANILWIVGFLLLINGLFTYQYLVVHRKSRLSRGLQLLFIMIFFYFYALLFIIIGLIDVFVDLRDKSRRRIYG